SINGTSHFRSYVEGLGYNNGANWIYPALVGPPSNAANLLCGSPPVSTCGRVVYEGANNYGSSSSSAPYNKMAGQHIVYDTILSANAGKAGTGTNTTTDIELSRSTPVGNPSTGEFYVGTFNWKYTVPTANSGNLQWNPAPGTYPYASGHFRAYKNLAQAGVP